MHIKRLQPRLWMVTDSFRLYTHRGRRWKTARLLRGTRGFSKQLAPDDCTDDLFARPSCQGHRPPCSNLDKFLRLSLGGSCIARTSLPAWRKSALWPAYVNGMFPLLVPSVITSIKFPRGHLLLESGASCASGRSASQMTGWGVVSNMTATAGVATPSTRRQLPVLSERPTRRNRGERFRRSNPIPL